LHFNWHDDAFRPAPDFDFFMAGPEDLRSVDETPFHLIPMDACNFTPASYRPFPAVEKFWDVLAVGNPVAFKRPEVLLRTIRQLFDQSSRPLRVLYICPLPTRRFMDEDTVLYDVRAYYEALFSAEERSRFVLLTTEFDSPNPFDRNSLSVFFRNSRVFLHCPTDERRCRIAAYAWCAGLPVVAYSSVASILPPALRVEPGYFEITSDGQYVQKILSALETAEQFDAKPYAAELSEGSTVNRLRQELATLFAAHGEQLEGPLLAANLDRRLGWHHQGIGGPANGLTQPLSDYIAVLYAAEWSNIQRAALETADYPERLLDPSSSEHPPATRETVERQSIYLNPNKRRMMRVYKMLRSKIGLE
jgi:hypothetical protein